MISYYCRGGGAADFLLLGFVRLQLSERAIDILLVVVMKKFFIIGDVGEPGGPRARVADAMRACQVKWLNSGVEQVSFVLTTGDNVYGTASDAAFTSLKDEVLDKVPLPSFFCLGNHDVKSGAWLWHSNRHLMRGAASTETKGDSVDHEHWTWICPAPAYSVPREITGLFLDIHIINTNKKQRGRSVPPPGPAPDFYVGNDKSWWRQQKQSLETKLQNARHKAGLNTNACVHMKPIHTLSPGRPWRLVLGHHPAEYVPLSVTEHHLPVLRYLKTTFMRGSG